MLFNSFQYCLFLPLVVLGYFSLPHRFRGWFLLVASYYFYMCWRWEYAALIAGVTLINYVCGLGLHPDTPPARRKLLVGMAVVGSLAVLFFFKYFHFAWDSMRAVAGWVGARGAAAPFEVVLPVGISFFTFQALSYTLDVYRGQTPIERDWGRFALYVVFFPQLVAGPIERSTHLLPQCGREHHLAAERLSSGLKLFLWGLFKKVVIADRLAEYVNRVYAAPELYNGSTLALATYFFAFQIYCDFSGYSDMAIGSARILGFDLMQNFRLPYLARSISDFWRRWHISLSTWFRDYLYIPLGGNRVPWPRWAFNVMVTFLVSGLWHGANWTFVIWGALHGGFFLAERALGPPVSRWCVALRLPARLVGCLQVILTFHLVTLAWVFFRAKNVSDAWLILTRLATSLGEPLYLGSSQVTTMLSVLLILLLLGVMLMQQAGRISLYFSPARMPAIFRWGGYWGLLVGIALLGRGSHEFIYFQF